uniref:Uncharacterized protein n=1 Tax=Tanacetum cinerariifolium TaxID=118510 RepID=A0A6L2NSV8_TANCI|nr:hypothetical protein [Tanacetum cinerariifolium]
MLFPVWSSGSTNPHNTNGDAAFDEKEPEFEGKKHESEVNVSPSSSAQSKKHDNKTKREAKARVLAAGPSNVAASPTHGKSSFINTSQYTNDPNMLELEDITYSDDEDDVGAEADFNNLETSITVSPIPTTRVHKDHTMTQIIGDLSSAIQTRSMSMVKDKQEKDKIGSKPNKNRKRGEARKSQKQLQSREQEKLKKMQVEGPKCKILQALLMKGENKGTRIAIYSKCKENGHFCQLNKVLLELMLSKRSKKKTKCVNAVSEELTAAKHNPQVVSAAKFPILNPNEFDLWKIRIEQYFLMTYLTVLKSMNQKSSTHLLEAQNLIILLLSHPLQLTAQMIQWNIIIAIERVILPGNVGLPRTQEGLLLLSPKEGMFQLRPPLQMHWSLSMMVQEPMIGAIK